MSSPAQKTSKTNYADFIAGGGKTGDLIRSIDWSKTSLGPVSRWPLSLKTSVNTALKSRFPMLIWWGEDLTLIYNDAYIPIFAGKHPGAMGKPGLSRQGWGDEEVKVVIEPMLRGVIETGEPTWSENQLLILERKGFTEECYFTWSYSPIEDDHGKVSGVLTVITETTKQVLSQRRINILRDLGEKALEAKTLREAYGNVVEVLRHHPLDLPFFMLYVLEEGESKLTLSSASGHQLPEHCCPEKLSIDDFQESNTWPAHKVFTTSREHLIYELENVTGKIPGGSWPENVNTAFITPIIGAGQKKPFGILISGVSPRLEFDDEYRSFLKLLTDQIATAISNVRTIEEERKRAEALAEIDRAKTAFFSNISHEFRTPLTLMLSPLEEVLETSLSLTEVERKNLATSHRNTLRLQNLVNTLLDFSRIEAGRMDVKLQQVDIATLTEDLASSFRSAIENAGIEYEVLTEHAAKPVLVDVDMWEKIVLNLISNAFKYTQQGKISVHLTNTPAHIALSVRDSGVGIPEEDQDKIFQRFYRVNNELGRSQEGTGIGLSMVKELVHLMHGEISVESTQAVGSVFTIRIPFSNAFREIVPLPSCVNEKSNTRKAFVEEASGWTASADHTINEKPATSSGEKPKIVLADDNSDMREYVLRLLSNDFDVIAETNGEHAYNKISKVLPDLVISDIMMPKLDGFGLLKKLRSNFSTRNIPVIFLSARAGEEAKVEGIQAGADDYLVKPFSAKELVARVTNHITISRARRESEKQFFNLFLQAPAHIHVMRGPEHIFEFFHPLAKDFTGGKDFTGLKVREAVPELEGQGYFEMLDQVYHEGKVFSLPESKAFLKNKKGELEEFYFHITYLPWRDLNGQIIGVLQFSFDVTSQAKARLAMEEAEYKLQNAIDLGELGTWHIDLLSNSVAYDSRVDEWWGIGKQVAPLDEIINCIHPDDRQKVADAVNNAVNHTGFYEAEYRLYHAVTKRERYIKANGRVFYDDNKKPLRLSGIVRDITLERSANLELERLVSARTAELQNANFELKRSNEELQQFAYVASHDLREPLRKIQTFSDMAKENLPNLELASSYLEKIDSSAARMSSLIKDVLTYSQASKTTIEFEKIDLNEMIRNVTTDFELIIQEKKATISVDDLPSVHGNKFQFHQLFSNLIGNALKFSEAEPVVTVSYGESDSPIPNNPDQKFHLITVRDNGIGFDQAYAEQIFQLFSRLHNRKDYGGTGIGLGLCRKIVENHGGMIIAESAKQKGATFKIFLPKVRGHV